MNTVKRKMVVEENFGEFGAICQSFTHPNSHHKTSGRLYDKWIPSKYRGICMAEISISQSTFREGSVYLDSVQLPLQLMPVTLGLPSSLSQGSYAPSLGKFQLIFVISPQHT